MGGVGTVKEWRVTGAFYDILDGYDNNNDLDNFQATFPQVLQRMKSVSPQTYVHFRKHFYPACNDSSDFTTVELRNHLSLFTDFLCAP